MSSSAYRFLLDRIRPDKPIDIGFNQESWKLLAAIAHSNIFPHIILYGPPGSGKKLFLRHLLRELFNGDEVEKMQLTDYKVASAGNTTKKTVPIMQSNYHIVIHPNNNNFDKYILQDVTTQYARQVPFEVFEAQRPFRAVVVNGIDQISKQAQMSLRSTMENYSRQCRFIMLCTNFYKVIKPLRSRCFCVRLQAPTEDQVQSMLARAILSCRLPTPMLSVLTIRTRDARAAFRKLEALRWGVSDETSYDTQIVMIVKLMLQRDSDNLLLIRAAFYELMITNFTGTQIITSIVNNLLSDDRVSDVDKIHVCDRAAHYEARNIVARREIKHLEAFAISVMNRIKLSAEEMKKAMEIEKLRKAAERKVAAALAATKRSKTPEPRKKSGKAGKKIPVKASTSKKKK
jgi:replication factor C subunit 3/5